MRAHIGTEITLDTPVRVPARDIDADASFFISRRAERRRSVHIIGKGGNRKLVPPLRIDLALDAIHIIDQLLIISAHRICEVLVLCRLPGRRDLDFFKFLRTRLDRLVVHLDDVIALFRIRLRRRVFHIADRFFFRNDAGNNEKRGLQYRIDPSAEADLLPERESVDRVKMNALFRDIALDLPRKVLFQLLFVPRTVEQERTAFFQILYHIVFVYISRHVAGDKIRLVDQVRRLDRLVAKAQVRNRHTTGFLRIVVKICLHILFGVVTDDLNGVLIGPDRTVGAHAPELTARRASRARLRALRPRKRQIRHVVLDAERKSVLRRILKHGHDVRRIRVLRTESVAAAEHGHPFKLTVF